MIKKIQKRTGKIVPFDVEKINIAMEKAFESINQEPKDLDKLTNLVLKEINAKLKGVPSVEDVSDIIELILMKKNPNVAKAYILFREYKKRLREIKKAYIGSEEKSNLTINAIKVLEARYLLRDNQGNVIETPNQMFRRVANYIAKADEKILSKKELEKLVEKYYNILFNLDFLPNSPTLMNAGTDLGQLSACFVLPVGDSMTKIFDAIKYTALIHQSGGGTGFSFSKLRPKGALVKSTKGVASGPVSFMKVFDAATDVIKQGGKRRGANMGILRVDHPDIMEFISCKQNEGKISNFNISVGITDVFMNAVENNLDYNLIDPHTGNVSGKLNARSVFDFIANMAWQNGEPGIVFLDEINRHNQVSNMGDIEATNPCVIGDTLISTEFGLMRMKDLYKKYKKGNVKIATDLRAIGKSCVKQNKITRVIDNGIKQVYLVKTESGYEIKVTKDHKFLNNKKKWVELKDLKKGDLICIQSGKGKFNSNKKLFENKYAKNWTKGLGQIIGWLVGDGWLKDGKDYRVGFVFGKDDFDLMKSFAPKINKLYGKTVKNILRENGIYHLSYHSKSFVEFFKSLGVKAVKSNKKVVPESIFTATENAVKGFLQGLFSADGTVGEKDNEIRLTSASIDLVKGVQQLLLNLGMTSKIYERKYSNSKPFEYVNKAGELKKYTSKGVYFELIIDKDARRIFAKEIGFLNHKQSKLVSRIKVTKKQVFEDKIVSIKKVGKERVYDLTEPKTVSFISNGFVSFDCGEQPLLPYESCNLGSINLANMVDDGKIDWKKLETVVRLAVRFLDSVIDMNNFPLPQIESMTKSSRKIGLGVMGWADMLLQLHIPYDSDDAIYLAEKVMKFITDSGVDESVKLGELKGNFPAFKGSYWDSQGYKYMRNSTITTIAPTGTIGMIADTSSGIEPQFSLAYTRLTLDNQEFIYTNKYLEKELKERGIYTDELMHKILKTGMINDVEEIPDDLRKVFVTSREINPKWHIKMQAAFQKYVHNAVSKTINMPNDATVDDVKEAYKLAYDLKCKGLTIYRDNSRKLQILTSGTSKKESVPDKKPILQKLITKKIPDDECPICHSKMVAQEGCYTCPKCSYSKCS